MKLLRVIEEILDTPKRPLTREHLLQVTRVHEGVFDGRVDVHILWLKRKLEIEPSASEMSVTERGIGHVFALTVEDLIG